MTAKLKKLRIHEISLVPRGANPHARVALHKAHGDREAAWLPCRECPTAASGGGGACRKARTCMQEIARRGQAAHQREVDRIRKGAEAVATEQRMALAKSEERTSLAVYGRALARSSAELIVVSKQGRR